MVKIVEEEAFLEESLVATEEVWFDLKGFMPLQWQIFLLQSDCDSSYNGHPMGLNFHCLKSSKVLYSSPSEAALRECLWGLGGKTKIQNTGKGQAQKKEVHKKEVQRKRRNHQLSPCVLNGTLEVVDPGVSLILHVVTFRYIMNLLVFSSQHLSCMLSCAFVGYFPKYGLVNL